jgi:antitoxin VapB
MDTPSAGVRPRAKLFRNGRSQAVRLPKEFRLPGSEVYIRRDGPRIVLEPLACTGLPLGFWDEIDRLGEGADFGDVEPLAGRLLDLAQQVTL